VLPLTAGVIVAGALAFAPAPLEKPDNHTIERQKQIERRRRNELELARALQLEEFRFGKGTFSQAFDASRRLLLANLALAETPKERATAHAVHLDLVRAAVKVMFARYEAGRITKEDYRNARAVFDGAKTDWLMASGRHDTK
jgi:outer membrane protein TolC